MNAARAQEGRVDVDQRGMIVARATMCVCRARGGAIRKGRGVQKREFPNWELARNYRVGVIPKTGLSEKGNCLLRQLPSSVITKWGKNCLIGPGGEGSSPPTLVQVCEESVTLTLNVPNFVS